MNEAFFADITAATKETFAMAVDEFGPDGLAGFSLYTDESFMSLAFVVNTVEYLHSNWEDDPDLKETYRWSPGEWEIDDYNPERLEGVNEILLKRPTDIPEKVFHEIRGEFFEGCLKALESIKAGIPDDINDDFVLVFGVSDRFEAKEEKEWMLRLNGTKKKALHDLFLKGN
jgi:hypothetical protein